MILLFEHPAAAAGLCESGKTFFAFPSETKRLTDSIFRGENY
jgi:hypothetical protein